MFGTLSGGWLIIIDRPIQMSGSTVATTEINVLKIDFSILQRVPPSSLQMDRLHSYSYQLIVQVDLCPLILTSGGSTVLCNRKREKADTLQALDVMCITTFL